MIKKDEVMKRESIVCDVCAKIIVEGPEKALPENPKGSFSAYTSVFDFAGRTLVDPKSKDFCSKSCLIQFFDGVLASVKEVTS